MNKYRVVRMFAGEDVSWMEFGTPAEAREAMREYNRTAPLGEEYYLQGQWDEEMKRSKKRVYISGTITGRDPDEVKEDFNTMEELVNEEAGDLVVAVNPLRNGLPESASWAEHMMRDLEILSECDAILYMHGWEDSKGVAVEKAFAKGIGLREFYADMDTFENMIDWAVNG